MQTPDTAAAVIVLLGAAAATTAIFVRAMFAEKAGAWEELRALLARREEELADAKATLRVAALGRDEDGRRIQLYRRIVSELPIGIAVLRVEKPADPDSWLIVDFNPAGMRLSAAGEENPSGRRLLDFAPELRGGPLPRACVEALRRGREVELDDFPVTSRAPGRRFSIRAFPLGGPLLGLAFEDVTARKSAEAALSRSNEELTQFAYVASHDLQTPLRKASAFAEQLRLRLGDGLDATSLDFLRRMGRSLEGMQELIDALLSLARITSREAAPQDVDLSATASEVLSDLDAAIAASRAHVRVGRLPVVKGDPRQLKQLLQNLVGNALKFTEPGRPPRVRVRARALEGGGAELVVEDDGIGFDMKFAERIFQPFQRLHARHEYPGSGMGLAICRRIVDRRGGSIAVVSAPGRGARFTIVLPAVAAPVEALWSNASESFSSKTTPTTRC
ncbi:MAG: ATP-binding protein [Elusimicrobia bacterium]|nr:ATP-binding protein [Elusimicrobiota bacterium]